MDSHPPLATVATPLDLSSRNRKAGHATGKDLLGTELSIACLAPWTLHVTLSLSCVRAVPTSGLQSARVTGTLSKRHSLFMPGGSVTFFYSVFIELNICVKKSVSGVVCVFFFLIPITYPPSSCHSCRGSGGSSYTKKQTHL